MSAEIDGQYYEVVRSRSLAERLLMQARRRIYVDFLDTMRPAPDDTILDVGVSDVINDGANVLERSYPHPGKITACGLGAGAGFSLAYPAVRYVRIEPNVPLPFADRSFAIATANAVLEHVGSHDNQVRFIRELARVAHRVFISVPNRYFPVEHHTAMPLLHYTGPTFSLGCRLLGKATWSDPANLILMTRRRLERLAAEAGIEAVVATTGLGLGPFSSNLYLARSPGAARPG